MMVLKGLKKEKLRKTYRCTLCHEKIIKKKRAPPTALDCHLAKPLSNAPLPPPNSDRGPSCHLSPKAARLPPYLLATPTDNHIPSQQHRMKPSILKNKKRTAFKMQTFTPPLPAAAARQTAAQRLLVVRVQNIHYAIIECKLV